MKRAIVLAGMVVGLGLYAGNALACPTSGGGGRVDFREDPRPIVRNTNTAATELFERAADLESAANTRERAASARERDAELLANRARILRNQAQLVGFSDRQSVLAVADDLAVRAATERAQAAEDRATAASFRAQARTLRERAVLLVRGQGGGGGWKGRDTRPVPRATGETAI